MTDDAQPQEAPSSPRPADASDPSRAGRLVLLGVVLAIALGLDLWSKAWAWEHLRTGPAMTVLADWLTFEFGFNTGSAFSFLRDAAYARVVFILVTIVALVYMARLALTLPTRYASAFVAVGLVSAGAIGNLHDRLVRVMEIRGVERYGVVDFIKVEVYYWPGRVWPTFNVADIALVIGVGLLFVFLARHGDTMDAKPSDP